MSVSIKIDMNLSDCHEKAMPLDGNLHGGNRYLVIRGESNYLVDLDYYNLLRLSQINLMI